MLPPPALALIAAAGAASAPPPPPCPAGTTPQPQPCAGHAGRFYCPSNRTAGQCDVPGNHPATCPKCDHAAPPPRFPLCHCPCAGCPTAAPYGTLVPPFPATWSLVNSTVIGNAGNQNGWLSVTHRRVACKEADPYWGLARAAQHGGDGSRALHNSGLTVFGALLLLCAVMALSARLIPTSV